MPLPAIARVAKDLPSILMNTYTAHVWKELRAERRTLFLLALLLPATIGLLTAFLPRHTLGDGIAVDLVVVICLVTTLTAIGADLLPRERRGTGALLARVPGALSASFGAKLTLYLGLLGAAILYGIGIAVMASLVRRDALPGGLGTIFEPWKLGCLIVVALSVFAVSSWLPRGALALPATGFFLVSMSLPFWGVFQGHPMFRVETVHVALGGAAIGLGALASAWMTFVWGGRGRTARVSVIAGLAMAGLGFAPSWLWSAMRWDAAYSRVPVVDSVHIGEDGRHAFVTVARRQQWRHPWNRRDGDPYSAVLVDTHTGGWELVGTPESSIWTNRMAHARPITSRRYARVGLLQLDETSAQLGAAVEFDGRTGRALDVTAPILELPAALLELGLTSSDLEEQRAFVIGRGTGYWVKVRDADLQRRLGSERLLVDPATGRQLTLEALEARFGDRARSVLIADGVWMLSDHDGWLRFDPETLEAAPIPELVRSDYLYPFLSDGSAIVKRDRRPLRFWPATGELVELELLGFDTDDAGYWRGLGVPEDLWNGHVPADRPSVVRCTSDNGEHLAILDPTKNTLRLAAKLEVDWNHERTWFGEGPPRYRVYAADERRALFTVDGRALERYDLATGEVTTLFDPAWLD